MKSVSPRIFPDFLRFFFLSDYRDNYNENQPRRRTNRIQNDYGKRNPVEKVVEQNR